MQLSKEWTRPLIILDSLGGGCGGGNQERGGKKAKCLWTGAGGSSFIWIYHTASSPVELLCFLFPIKDSHLDVKFKCRYYQKEGAQELLPQRSWLYFSCFLLNYLSWASVLHYLYIMSQRKWKNGCSFLICPLTVDVPHGFQVSVLLFSTYLSSYHSGKRGASSFLVGWVKPAWSQIGDNSQSQPHFKIRSINLFRKLHSSAILTALSN